MSRTARGQSRHAQVYRLSERRTLRRFMESLRWGRAFGHGFGIRGSK